MARSIAIFGLGFILLSCGGSGGKAAAMAGGGASAGGAPSTAAIAGGSSSAGANTSGASGEGPSSGGGANGGASAGGEQSGSGGADEQAPNVHRPTSPTASWVYVSGYRLMVGKRAADGTLATPAPYTLKGVGWAPAGIGESNSQGYAKLYTSHAAEDVPLIADLHANTVKTYDRFEPNAAGSALLDRLYTLGVMVIMNVMPSISTSQQDCVAQVNYFKHHPAILGWMVGNEFNYNNLYGAPDFDAAVSIVNSALAAIHAADPDHPVIISHGEVPSATTYQRVGGADIWALNLYPNLDLSSRFSAWAKLSNKPMMVGEYGADAFNNGKNAEDQPSQATATSTLTLQIIQHYSSAAVDAAHPVLGGSIYELSDEWWKAGDAKSHDNGGMANAIYPDGFANEEWWGLTSVQRQPRAAYTALAALYAAN